jgi:(1->4)-alpha-D-glucan 1-alpha-D-glucosylmutase
VTDPNRIDEALGGEPAWLRLLDTLRNAGMDCLVDLVPNHMSVATDQNLWWWDVLENGASSVYASTFDVDWDGPTEEAKSKVLLPILGDHYGRALRDQRITVSREPSGVIVTAFQRKLPVSPASLAPLLLIAARESDCPELEILAGSLNTVANEEDPWRHHRQQGVIKTQIAALLSEKQEPAAVLDRLLADISSSPDKLDELLSHQFYRLVYYRVARYDLDYRRFFDIHELAALSIHDPEVFEQTHALVLRLIEERKLTALRVDHPDGLRDPAEYFRRLRGRNDELWIVAEKILQPGERLPEDWPVDGTTGYDFLGVVGALFVNSDAEAILSKFYEGFVGDSRPFPAEVRDCKRLVLDDLLASDLWRLARALGKVCASKHRQLDFANEELRRALREVLACLPVYRTYAQPTASRREQDVIYVRQAVAAASEERPELDRTLLGLLEELLSGGASAPAEWEFVARFQQLAAATMAKGYEDTAFYRYQRLISLNEVGGDPGLFGVAPRTFHDFCAELQQRWPATLLTTTTHDTKRSEDARLRVTALSELAEEWIEVVQHWSEVAHATTPGPKPDRATEYLLWQTLIAAYPITEQRLTMFLQKAMREAKVHTSWSNPNASYENAVLSFARGAIANPEVMGAVVAFVEKILPIAYRSSLSQTLLKLTACGVPDIYQGAELWDTRLTDPDNRGHVEFTELARILERCSRATAPEVLSDFESGAPKLWLIQKVLELRRKQPEWFGSAAPHLPLHAMGVQAARTVAFRRGQNVIVVAPRLWGNLLAAGFGDTQLDLPPGTYQNLFEQDVSYCGRVDVGQLLSTFPVALLFTETAS